MILKQNRMRDESWQAISTAPKDGRVVMVGHEEVGTFCMAWNPTATNHMFAAGELGLWEAPDRSMTWREGDEEGPSHWKPLACEAQ